MTQDNYTDQYHKSGNRYLLFGQIPNYDLILTLIYLASLSNFSTALKYVPFKVKWIIKET